MKINYENNTLQNIIEKKWTVKSIALDISGTCNLDCRYCAESATQPKRLSMTQETMDEAWSFLFPDGIIKKNTSIHFGSGEPFLALPILKRLDQLIKLTEKESDDDSFKVFITSNGTLIDDEICDWLIHTGWNVKISLDGPRDIQDAWRVTKDGKGTYDIVSRVVSKLSKEMNDKLSVTSVLCRNTDPERVFESIASLGVKKIELVPVAHNNKELLPSQNDVNNYKKFIQSYANRCLNTNIENMPTLVRFSNKVTRTMGYDTRYIPCGAGRSFVGIGSDGYIYPCFRFIGIEPYKIGNIHTGINEIKAKSFLKGSGRTYIERQPCRNCWAAQLCGGPCFSCAEFFESSDGMPSPLQCEYILADASSASWLVKKLRNENPEKLLYYLPKKVRNVYEEANFTH